MTDAKPTGLDPITAEIIRANLVAITDEMKSNLMRTAYNQIIYEAQDFTVGLFDAEGHTVSIGLGLPMFVGGLSEAIKAKIAHYGIDGFTPGDIILTNDAYIMGSHLNHMIFTMPIFADGKVIAFASSMAHWMDVGGVLGGTTHDIYSEGLQMPIVKIFKGGVQDDELTRIIMTNVRFSDLALGDLRAQVAAVHTGEHRFSGLVTKYGADTVLQSISEMFERSEMRAREAVTLIEDGEYWAETAMDDDGVALSTPVPIKVRVVVKGDQLTVDLSHLSPQVAGYFNSGETAGRSAVQVAFKALTSPSELPINEGSLRPVEVILPLGTVVSATRPAAMRWWMTYPMTVVDCIFAALDEAVPDGTIAGHHADIGVSTLFGNDPRNNRFFMFFHAAQGGGWGATRRADGQNATICINDGDTHNTPIEANEAKFPILAERYALRPDSGGAGKNRGGLGTIQSWRVTGQAKLNSFIERTTNPPWGLDGALAGAANRMTLTDADGGTTSFDNGKLDSVPIDAGHGFTTETGGGGGYGNPRERDTELVVADVRAGYISIESARDHYGVAVVADGYDFTVDESATATLRAGSPS